MTATSVRPRTRVRIGKLWIDSLTFSEALDEIERLVTAREGGSVFTPNVDHVVNAEVQPPFQEAYDAATLSLVDSQPLVWASRLLGAPLPERVAGSDLILPLMARAGLRRWRVYLLGGAPGVAQAAAAQLERRFGTQIVGVDSSAVSLHATPEDERVIERIRDRRPDLLLVALGAPKQELWIHRSARRIRPAVAIGVGAALDFIAGHVARAPRWMARAGLEWLFRLLHEPRRLAHRYLVDDPKFFLILYRMLRRPGEPFVKVLDGPRAERSSV